MTLYQAYTWNGTVYRPISVPKKNKKRAYNEAYTICMSPYPESEACYPASSGANHELHSWSLRQQGK